MANVAAVSDSGASAQAKASLPTRIILGWGVGAFAAGTMYQVMTVLLLRYMIDYVGIAAALAGALIGFSKLYDAVADPFIGALSDRTRSPWGRRRPFILVGGIVSACSFAALFAIATVKNIEARDWIAAAALIVNTTGYALLSIPHLAMPSEMTTDFHERTTIMSFRVGGLALAQLSGTALGPWLIVRYGGGAMGHAVMGLAIGAIILVGAVVCFLATRAAPATQEAAASGFTTLEKLKLALGNKPFVSLIACKMSNLTGVGWYFAILPFLFTTVTHAGYGRMGVYFIFQGLATFGSQPLWVWLSREVGKKRAFYLAASFYGLGVATWCLARPGESVDFTIARAIFIGVMGGGTLLAATSLLPDAIAHDFDRTGLRREGVFAGVYTTVEKASSAIAAALIGVILGLAGYAQGHAGGPQPASAVSAVRMMTLAPLVFCVLAAFILSTYRLPDRGAAPPVRRSA